MKPQKKLKIFYQTIKMTNIERFQKLRNNCPYCKDHPTEGLQCTYNGRQTKCCLDKCPRLTHTPSFPMENKNHQKDNVLSQVNDKKALTFKEEEALKLHNNASSYQKIADKLNVSKTQAYNYVMNAKKKLHIFDVNDKPHTLTPSKKTMNDNKIRLHNDEIKTKAEIDWKNAQGEIIPLKYTQYKLYKDSSYKIKIFKNNTLVIRFLTDTWGDNVEEAILMADQRILDFLDTLNMPGIKIVQYNQSYEQLSRHYGLVGNNIAKKCIKEGKKIVTYDLVDGKPRLRIDFSKRKFIEADAEHLIHGKEDAIKFKALSDDMGDRTEEIFTDAQNNDIDLMSITKKKLDKLKEEFGDEKTILHQTIELTHQTIELTNQNAKIMNLFLKKDLPKKELKTEEEIPFERPSYIG